MTNTSFERPYRSASRAVGSPGSTGSVFADWKYIPSTTTAPINSKEICILVAQATTINAADVPTTNAIEGKVQLFKRFGAMSVR